MSTSAFLNSRAHQVVTLVCHNEKVPLELAQAVRNEHEDAVTLARDLAAALVRLDVMRHNAMNHLDVLPQGHPARLLLAAQADEIRAALARAEGR